MSIPASGTRTSGTHPEGLADSADLHLCRFPGSLSRWTGTTDPVPDSTTEPHEFTNDASVTADVAWINFSDFRLSGLYFNGQSFAPSNARYDDRRRRTHHDPAPRCTVVAAEAGEMILAGAGGCRWRNRSQAAIGSSSRPWQRCCQPS